MSDLGVDQFVMVHRLLEWCQDAATLASAAVGYPTARYIEMGGGWYIRQIVALVPGRVTFADDVEVETWVSDIRRFRSRREYLIFANGEVAAQVCADWMFLKLDRSAGTVRPFHFDQQMLAAFLSDPAVAVDPDAIPSWQTEFSPVGSTERTAHRSEMDRHGHMNHVHYASWVLDHAHATVAAGARPTQLRLQYQKDVRPGQTITLELDANSDTIHHRLTRAGEPIARAVTRFEA